MVWGSRHQAQAKAADEADNNIKSIRSRGQQVPDKFLRDKGEAITNKADMKEAAKNERNQTRR